MIRLASWYFISIAVSYMSLFFSTTIILDLYYVLKNPFTSTEARIKKLTILTVILSITFSGIGLRLTLSKEKLLSSLNLILFILITLWNFCLGIIIMSFVFYRFRTKGMSKQIKQSIQKRYLEFIIVYCLLEGPFIYHAKPHFEYQFVNEKYKGYVGAT